MNVRIKIGNDYYNVDRDEGLRECARLNCEESLARFLAEFWKYIDPAPYQHGWVVDAICEHLEAIVDGDLRHTIFNVPPRSLKSSLCSVAFPAFVWAQRWTSHTSGPGVKFLHASYADKLSVRDSVKCRRIIESPRYQELWRQRFALSGDQNAKHRFSNDKGGERLITSIGAGVTGEGGDCFVAGTLIETPHGSVPIEHIRRGDAVLSFDHLRDEVVVSRVTATREVLSNDICEIHAVSGHSARCTSDHRIYSPGRGYIRADELGSGDRLFVCDARGGTEEARSPFDMRQLRERNYQAIVSSTQGTEAEQSGCLLRQRVRPSSPRSEKFYGRLSSVWETLARSSREILRRCLQEGSYSRQGLQPLASSLSAMWRGILRQQQALLFSGVCGQSAFSADGWSEKFEICVPWEVFQSISANGRYYPDARWASLRRMPCSRKSQERQDWSYEGLSPSASFGREYAEQLSGEFDCPLRAVPPETPRGHLASIAKTTRIGSGTHRVYDIQVETQSNFFANGILAHNCIIIDDPNAANEVESEATIESTLEWWRGTMPTRLNDPKRSVYIVIQQRLAENDLSGEILEKQAGDWTHVMIPARYEADRSFVTSIGWKDPRTVDGELYWPERFGEEELTRLEKQLGPFRSAGQLAQRPEPKGGGIIKREWWQPWEEENLPPISFMLAYLDTAYTTKTENDYSALTIWGVFRRDTVVQPSNWRVQSTERNYAELSPKVLLLGAWRERLELHDLVTKVAKSCYRGPSKTPIDKLLIENKAAGYSVAQEIRRLYGAEEFAVQLIDPGMQDKLARLYSVQHLFAERLIYAPAPKDHPMFMDWAEMVVTEVGSFPRGKHDDLTDTVSGALRHLRDLGLLQRAPEIRQEMEDEMRFTGQRRQTPLYPA